MNYEGDFKGFYQERLKEKQHKENVITTREQITWYSDMLKDRMWQQGPNIAISNGNPCSLQNWDENDDCFEDSKKFYNTKGNLKGGRPAILSELIKTKNYAN